MITRPVTNDEAPLTQSCSAPSWMTAEGQIETLAGTLTGVTFAPLPSSLQAPSDGHGLSPAVYGLNCKLVSSFRAVPKLPSW